METNVMGIIRPIDDLGRIVIPKELRMALNIANGESLEILGTNNGGVFIRKPIEVKPSASVEVTTETTITVTPVEEKKTYTLYGEDYLGEIRCIKITKEQLDFLNELSNIFGDTIPWGDMSEDSPTEIYDFTK